MRLRTINALILTAVALLLVIARQEANAANASAEEHFSVREYNLFHDVLHPLQHEALPKRDFKTIRTRATELVTRGRAIIKLGVPAGVHETAEFAKELQNFETALSKFEVDAQEGTDAQLEESYNAVHDTFEMLASMLPRK